MNIIKLILYPIIYVGDYIGRSLAEIDEKLECKKQIQHDKQFEEDMVVYYKKFGKEYKKEKN